MIMHAIIYFIFNLLRSDGSRAEQDNKEELQAMKVYKLASSKPKKKEQRLTWLLCGLDGSYDGT